MSNIQSLELKIIRTISIFDFFYIRNLRNSIRLNMTGNTNYISLYKQLLFFFNRPKNITLYVVTLKNSNIGYILIHMKERKIFITEAIEKNHRQSGIGTFLLDFIKNEYQDFEIFADILHKNIASSKLHEKNGFIKIASNENFSTFRYAKNPETLN